MTKEWHSRGYLPHWERGETPQSITFRLGDSLPSDLLARWQQELDSLPDDERLIERRRRIQVALDHGYGNTWLTRSPIADLVERSFLHFDGERYRLHAWCIMPNHVHVLVTIKSSHTLTTVMQAGNPSPRIRPTRYLGEPAHSGRRSISIAQFETKCIMKTRSLTPQ